jgi:ribonuclease P protein component
MAFTFTKSERLCNKSVITQLFQKGNRGFTQFPFRFSWVPAQLESPYPMQVLITASKRNFPTANKRNQVKRQIRELYRLNKHTLYDAASTNNSQYALMISYLAKEKMLHQELSKVFQQAILRFTSDLKKTDTGSFSSANKVL